MYIIILYIFEFKCQNFGSVYICERIDNLRKNPLEICSFFTFKFGTPYTLEANEISNY